MSDIESCFILLAPFYLTRNDMWNTCSLFYGLPCDKSDAIESNILKIFYHLLRSYYVMSLYLLVLLKIVLKANIAAKLLATCRMVKNLDYCSPQQINIVILFHFKTELIFPPWFVLPWSWN